MAILQTVFVQIDLSNGAGFTNRIQWSTIWKLTKWIASETESRSEIFKPGQVVSRSEAVSQPGAQMMLLGVRFVGNGFVRVQQLANDLISCRARNRQLPPPRRDINLACRRRI